MSVIHKTFAVEIKEKRPDGGRILITTPDVDRDRDRVFPTGVKTDNYFKNGGVVQWGHDYRSPFATIGRSKSLEVSAEGVIADFDLRPAANDMDPQNIIRLLWEGGWVKTASIGFMPIKMKPNEIGGTDFEEVELLEWSLVPVPANPSAVALSVAKALGEREEFTIDELRKKGELASRAWIRQLTVESNTGEQILFACFRSWEITVPDDAEKLMSDEQNGFYPAPHPLAGQTIQQKEVTFIPPIEFDDDGYGKDAIFSMSSSGKDDAEMVKYDELWNVKALSDVLLAIPVTKSAKTRSTYSMDVCTLRHRDVQRVKAIITKRAATKRGRVLSAKNEEKIVVARDNLNDVLKQLEEQPADEEPKGATKVATTNESVDEADAKFVLDAGDERDLVESLKTLVNLMKEVLE